MKASDFIRSKKHFPGTSVKFKKTKSGIKIKSAKHPKFGSGSKLNLK
jgi:hypothetical protein